MSSLKLFTPKRFRDSRGFFSEVYNKKQFLDQGLDFEFVQDNHSFSLQKYTVRGLHYQVPPHAQGKLIYCIRGAILDVAVDIRKGSPTYGKWKKFKLTEKNGNQLYVPQGYAHGYITLEPKTEIIYKCTEFYSPKNECSILWNDPDIGIEWPLINDCFLSEKDSKAPLFSKTKSPFIYGLNS